MTSGPLFTSFLDDASEYLACERFWESLVFELAAALGQEAEWPRWIPSHTPSGSPMPRDGNPIWDGRSLVLDRAFRVVQHAPLGPGIDFAAWLKSYEPEYMDLPRNELVLNLSLSHESARLARLLLRTWMTPGTSLDEMTSLIRTFQGDRT